MSGWANENASTKKSVPSEKDQWIEPPCEDSHVNSVGIRGSNMFLILSQLSNSEILWMEEKGLFLFHTKCGTLEIAILLFRTLSVAHLKLSFYFLEHTLLLFHVLPSPLPSIQEWSRISVSCHVGEFHRFKFTIIVTTVEIET